MKSASEEVQLIDALLEVTRTKDKNNLHKRVKELVKIALDGAGANNMDDSYDIVMRLDKWLDKADF